MDKDKRPKRKRLKALIACTNGVSSSLMLKAQLKELFSNIDLSSIHTIEEISRMPTTSYDLIFSTVDIASIKPVYIVDPLLSQIEKTIYFKRLHLIFQN
ncbi:hypothetical protein ACI2OX_05885 [Bacillus sp. N9]